MHHLGGGGAGGVANNALLLQWHRAAWKAWETTISIHSTLAFVQRAGRDGYRASARERDI